MTVTRRELDQPPVQTVFEIKDHSASSAWEKFSSQIRNVVEEWNLEERKPNTDSGAIIKNEHVRTNYHSYTLTFMDFTQCDSYISDFTAIEHPICKQYGLRSFITLTRDDNQAVSSTQARMMLSTLMVALADELPHFPVFAQIGFGNDFRFQGTYIRPTDTTHFRDAYLPGTPQKCMLVSQLADMFDRMDTRGGTQINGSRLPMLISARTRYLKQLIGTYPIGRRYKRTPVAYFPPHILSNSNSISGGTLSLGVAAEWTPRPIDKWLTAEQPTGTIDPTTASRYSLWAIPPKEAPVLELTSLLECFMKWDLNFHTASGINNNANGMIEGTLRYRRLSTRHGRRAEAPVLSMLTSENQLSRHFVEGDSEAPRALGKEGFEEMTAKHANSGYGYDPAGLSQAVNHLSTAIGSAGTQITTQGARLMRNSSHSTHKPGRHGLTQDDVVMMVSRCFNLKAEIEKKLAKGLERPPWNYNDPYQCITAALGMYMCVLDRHYRGIYDAALLWNDFVQTCRWHWHNLVPIPSVSPTDTQKATDDSEAHTVEGDDLQAPSPDLNCALVLQKLQMLNCCIQGKRLREKGVLDLKEQQRHTPLAQTVATPPIASPRPRGMNAKMSAVSESALQQKRKVPNPGLGQGRRPESKLESIGHQSSLTRHTSVPAVNWPSDVNPDTPTDITIERRAMNTKNGHKIRPKSCLGPRKAENIQMEVWAQGKVMELSGRLGQTMHVSDQPETVASVRGNTTVSSDDDECEFYDASSVPVSRRSSGSGDRTAPAPGPKPNPRGQGRGPEVRQVGKTDDTAHEVGRTSGQLQRLRPHQSNGTTDHSGDTSEPASDTSQQRVSGPKSQQQRTENRTPHASESGARVQHSSAEWGEIDDGRKEDRIGGRLTAKKSAGTFGSGEWHPRRTPGHSADVTPLGVHSQHETLKILSTGVPLNRPVIQAHVPLTIDMIEAQTEAMVNMGVSESATKERSLQQSESLLSDMKSFKAANPACELGDFVRWHSPRDWIEEEVAEDGSIIVPGRLSERMTVAGSLWHEAWDTAAAVPAALQRPLFNHTKEAENVFQYLENATSSDLLAAFLVPCLESSVRILNNCELQGIEPFDEALADLREKIKPLASSRDYEWSVDEMTATLHVMARAERYAMDCSTLKHGLLGAKSLVNALVKGRQIQLEKHQRRVTDELFKNFDSASSRSHSQSDGSASASSASNSRARKGSMSYHNKPARPETREYILQRGTMKHKSRTKPRGLESSPKVVKEPTVVKETHSTEDKDKVCLTPGSRMYVVMEARGFRMCTSTAESNS